MTKRKVFRLRWSKRAGYWCLTSKNQRSSKSQLQYMARIKSVAIQRSAWYARSVTPSQLVVHNRNGRIAFERTYGADPERHKG